jgi:hypothetical protein
MPDALQDRTDAKVRHILGEALQKALSNPLVAEQPIPGLPPGARHPAGDVIDGPRELNAQ